jgi:hypothetical protein
MDILLAKASIFMAQRRLKSPWALKSRDGKPYIHVGWRAVCSHKHQLTDFPLSIRILVRVPSRLRGAVGFARDWLLERRGPRCAHVRASKARREEVMRGDGGGGCPTRLRMTSAAERHLQAGCSRPSMNIAIVLSQSQARVDMLRAPSLLPGRDSESDALLADQSVAPRLNLPSSIFNLAGHLPRRWPAGARSEPFCRMARHYDSSRRELKKNHFPFVKRLHEMSCRQRRFELD